MPATQNPRVSVVLPFFAAASHLEFSLPALFAQQAPFEWEALLVDNGSVDEGRVLAEKLVVQHACGRARVLSATRPGSYAARQTGLDQARGSMVVFLDADCIVQPGWLAALVRTLEVPDTLIAGALVEGDPSQRSIVARYSARSHLLSQKLTLAHARGPFIQTASLAVRTTEARAAGGFDVNLFSAGDADFCWRMQALHGGRKLVECVEARILHRHRETIGALYAQFRRYGQGDVAMIRKHGLQPAIGVLRLGLDVLRLLLAAPLAVMLLPYALLRRDMVIALAPLLRCVRLVGRRHGQLTALLGGRSQRT
ncbi:MAG: glycosyltransferase [Planctomycetes bacterium]|nr:glycosyltransferase [Planctomycetota bacterium]